MVMDSKLANVVKVLARLSHSPPVRSSWEWAEANRILPDDSAEPGHYRSSRTPWVRVLSEAISDYRFDEVISVNGSQTAKTESLLNALGHRLHDNPGPCLWISPSEKHAISIAKDRLEKMLRSVPELWASIEHRKKSRFEFHVNGVRVGLGWAGSGIELSSHPILRVFADEIDFWEMLPGYGDPYVLAKKRTATYPDGTIVAVSTPTIGKIETEKHQRTGLYHWKFSKEVSSRIWRLYQEGTMVEFMMPCPSCNTHFSPRGSYIWYPDNCSPQDAELEAKMVCPHCSKLIEPYHKHQMIKDGVAMGPGQWFEGGVIKGDLKRTSIFSLFVSGLCSPWVEWGRVASNRVRAEQSGNSKEMQSCVNTDLGECFIEVFDIPDWEEVRERLRFNYKQGEVPKGVAALTLYADVQEESLVWVVCGWRINMEQLEMFVVDYGYLVGNTFEEQIWIDFEGLCRQTWCGLLLKGIGLDAGYNPSKSARAKNQANFKAEKVPRNIVYSFAREHREIKLTKGSSHPLSRPYTRTFVDVSHIGRVKRAGVSLWLIDTDWFKTTVYGKLNRKTNKPGRWYLPENVTDDFLKQITAEYKNPDTGKWETTRKDNHYLDALVGSVFLADVLGYNKGSLPRILKSSEEKPVSHHAPVKQPPPKKSRLDWDVGDLGI